jgi:hypothetical protein
MYAIALAVAALTVVALALSVRIGRVVSRRRG